MKSIWHNHALGIVLFAMFLFSWIMQLLTAEGYPIANDFWNATFENWQSEFLQVGVFVVITKYIIYKGSPQSRDDGDEMKTILVRIEKKLESK